MEVKIQNKLTEGTQDEYRHDREADEDLQSDSEYQDQSSDDSTIIVYTCTCMT